jgi:hypothetical protein
MAKARLLLVLFVLLLPVRSFSTPKVQFSRQVLPLLEQECLTCHSGPTAPSGYSMETPEKLRAGGQHGAAVLPGQSSRSNMIRYLLGQRQPQMPPGKPLSRDSIALLRRWIDEGATIDSMTVLKATGDRRQATDRSRQANEIGAGRSALAPHASRLTTGIAPVTALAYSPDGRLLAAGGYQTVRLIDTATGDIVRTLTGPTDQVLSLAWSSDDRWLAAAGGLAGVAGELCLWNAATWGKPRVRQCHSDTIYGIAWRPGAPEIATASLDKTVSIWDARSLIATRTLKDHSDAVFCVAYSPNGRWLATGSADRSVKLYQLAGDSPKATGGSASVPKTMASPSVPAGGTMRPAASLSHGDAVTAMVFGPKSDLLMTACLDKRLRVWPVQPGSVDNPLRSHGEDEPINAVAFSRDGSTFVWGSANHRVRVWNSEVSDQKWQRDDPADWVYAVAASPDGKTIAAGSGDGKLYFWSQPDGKLLGSQLLTSSASVAAASTNERPK